MRRIIGLMICVVMIAVACNKTVGPTTTAAEQLEKDINLIDEFLAEKNINAVKLESGVRYVINEMGTGAVPTKDNCVRFRYTGYVLYDTAAFESNQEDGIKSPLKSLVGGMQIGMKQMPVGTKGVIYMPSIYGYGSTPSTSIPANSCIYFEVEIVQLYAYNSLGNYCYE